MIRPSNTISSDTFPPWPVIHPKRHRDLLEETPMEQIVKHTVYRVSWDGNVEATQRSKNVKLYTWAVPAQVSPRAVQCCSHKPPEAQQEYLPSPNFLKFMILFGNHRCLLLSSPFEPNILVITAEIRVTSLTKENMVKCNKSSKKSK